MTFPDRIERTLELAQPPATVWAAVSTDAGLAAWFGDRATVDLRPGGTVTIGWEDHVVDFRVEAVEEPRLLALTWPMGDQFPDVAGDGRRTYVELTLEPLGDGTRLRLVESGFAQLDATRDETHAAHSEGWDKELGELADHLANA